MAHVTVTRGVEHAVHNSQAMFSWNWDARAGWSFFFGGGSENGRGEEGSGARHLLKRPSRTGETQSTDRLLAGVADGRHP